MGFFIEIPSLHADRLAIVQRALLRKRKMRVKQRWLWTMCLICLVGSVNALSLHAQEPPTPTPDADGVITVIVQPNDALWSIAARANISLATLLDLNNLTEDAFIQPGDRLIIGFAATPTAVSSPTSAVTRPPPTPRPTAPPPPPTVICLVAFNDSNGNGQREAEEPLQAGVAFTLFTDEAVIANYVTDGLAEPYCVTDLPPGTYQITRSVGREETLTNSGNRSVTLAAGDQVMLGFGGVVGGTPMSAAVSSTPSPTITIGNGASATAATVLRENDEERPFPVGAGILIGILLIGAAVFLSRRQS